MCMLCVSGGQKSLSNIFVYHPPTNLFIETGLSNRLWSWLNGLEWLSSKFENSYHLQYLSIETTIAYNTPNNYISSGKSKLRSSRRCSKFFTFWGPEKVYTLILTYFTEFNAVFGKKGIVLHVYLFCRLLL